jgi:hypothetical protein
VKYSISSIFNMISRGILATCFGAVTSSTLANGAEN